MPRMPFKMPSTAREITFPTIHDNLRCYQELVRVWRDVFASSDSAQISFRSCRFVNHVGVAFLAGMFDEAEHRGLKLTINQRGAGTGVMPALRRTGAAEVLKLSGNTKPYDSSVPYWRVQNPHDKMVEIQRYLSNEWLAKSPIDLGLSDQAAVASNTWEVYANAFDHGLLRNAESTAIHTCGQYYPKRRQLGLAIVDFGRGIPACVSEFFGSYEMTPPQMLKWALLRGKTTRRDIPGGLGLDLVRQFTLRYQGSLQIFSGSAYAEITPTKSEFAAAKHPFPGTIVNIHLNTPPLALDDAPVTREVAWAGDDDIPF